MHSAAAAKQAAALAAQGWLVSFGIAPTAPETGFGYLKQGAAIGEDGAFRVERFVEKPDLARAMEFLSSGQYAWNGGIFAFRAGTFLRRAWTPSSAHRSMPCARPSPPGQAMASGSIPMPPPLPACRANRWTMP